MAEIDVVAGEINDWASAHLIGAVADAAVRVEFEERVQKSVEYMNSRPLSERLCMLNMLYGGGNEPAQGIEDVTFGYEVGEDDLGTITANARLARQAELVEITVTLK